MATSISDYDAYRQICSDASKYPAVLRKFKTIKTYTKILEHTTINQGKQYIDEIRKICPDFDFSLDVWKKNDTIGGSNIIDWGPNIGKYSPSTLLKIFDPH